MAFVHRFVVLAPTLAAFALAACGADDSSARAPATDASAADACPSCGDAGLPLPNVDASVCHAADLSSWSAPSYTHASGAAQGKCDPAQIQAFYDACLGANATHDACVAATTNDACAACLVTRDDATAYGPLVEHGGVVLLNFAGCLELLDASSNGLACAREVQAVDACELAACAANCPVTDDATLKLYDQCAQDADAHACASFVQSAACITRETDAGAPSACSPNQTFEQAFYTLARIFCGAPAKDASTD